MGEREFSGEIVDYYARFRRGFPPEVTDALVAALGLDGDDVAVDLGCGTGQLTLPLADRVRAVIGMDPEPDMLERARSTAAEAEVANVSWLLGSDLDLPGLRVLLGTQTVGAVTIATAIHLMQHERLFQEAKPLLRTGGGITVIANGTPLWLLDTDWSRALHDCLDKWFGRKSTNHCGIDAESRSRYRDALDGAGYKVSESIVEYTAEISLEPVRVAALIGHVS